MRQYFGLTGKDRKSLVTAISDILGVEQKYCGPPRYEFTIGDYTVDRDGTLIGPDDTSLLAWLADKGFTPETGNEPFEADAQTEPETSPVVAAEPEEEAAEAENLPKPEALPEDESQPEPEAQPETETLPEPEAQLEAEPLLEPEAQPDIDTMTLTIEYPLEGMTDTAIINLRKLVTSKEPLLRMALGAEELPILLTDSTIKFPWFRGEIDGDTARDFAQLIACLCETAKRKKRVTGRVTETDNPRFSLRVFLISLGMIGPAYDGIRKRMIRPLSGESGWRFGKPQKAEGAPVEPAEAEETPVGEAEATDPETAVTEATEQE